METLSRKLLSFTPCTFFLLLFSWSNLGARKSPISGSASLVSAFECPWGKWSTLCAECKEKHKPEDPLFVYLRSLCSTPDCRSFIHSAVCILSVAILSNNVFHELSSEKGRHSSVPALPLRGARGDPRRLWRRENRFLAEIAPQLRWAVCFRTVVDYLLNENRLLYQLPMFRISCARIKPADRPVEF